MNDRDALGRFTPGNEHASRGGRRRAETLPAARRREIAAAGLRGLAEKHFGGNLAAAAAWLSRVGIWAGLFGTDSARERWAA